MSCTSPTVRALVEHNEIDGYWQQQRDGSCRFWLYRDAVEDFLARFGRFPQAKQRRKSSPDNAPAAPRLPEDPRLGLRVLALQEAVRTQDVVIQKLRAALRQRDVADEHLRDAEAARASSAGLIGEALDAYRSLLALEGIPDDPSSLAT
ncbi:hypothetical protein [Mycobacteroides chelonae]|uniref:hypothetical protein n=1 Tax=Mycobacteroides chelonae TaxID=1774 RepID=UPI0010427B5D|nr:hypothetical protein [Mycobacteroides chelonae]